MKILYRNITPLSMFVFIQTSQAYYVLNHPHGMPCLNPYPSVRCVKMYNGEDLHHQCSRAPLQHEDETPSPAASNHTVALSQLKTLEILIVAVLLVTTTTTTTVLVIEPAGAVAEVTTPSSYLLTTSEFLSSSTLQTQDMLSSSFQKALGGGRAGALAAIVQVFSLMWLRTAMNYQYRFGGSLSSTLKTLWSQGGIARLYQGLPFALMQGPLTRFADTFSNVGSLALLQQVVLLLESDPTQNHAGVNSVTTLVGILSSLPVKTALGSISAATFRILLMPIDTCKTVLQVDGGDGLQRLFEKVKEKRSLSPLYQGSLASAAATAVGHFPWFLTYNYLNEVLPSDQSIATSLLALLVSNPLMQLSLNESQIQTMVSLLRSAFLGFCASAVSDTTSNSLRVIKTTKQTAAMDSNNENTGDISYQEAVRMIVAKDGLKGLFGRGLQTRLITNAIQGSAFSVLWRYFQQH